MRSTCCSLIRFWRNLTKKRQRWLCSYNFRAFFMDPDMNSGKKSDPDNWNRILNTVQEATCDNHLFGIDVLNHSCDTAGPWAVELQPGLHQPDGVSQTRGHEPWNNTGICYSYSLIVWKHFLYFSSRSIKTTETIICRFLLGPTFFSFCPRGRF